MILGLFKISGHSMLPKFKPNDRIFVSTLPYFIVGPGEGDVILFKHNNKFMVKRITKITKSSIQIRGDNKSDSLKIKSISKKQIIGKVFLKL